MRPLSFIVLAIGALALSGGAFADELVGARRCKTCHRAAYAQWLGSAHAQASARLNASERRDPRCLSCHATDAMDGALGVQCESCHGAGEHYWPEHIMKDPGLARAIGLKRGDEPATCQRCHNEDTPSVVPFDLPTALERVSHGGPR